MAKGVNKVHWIGVMQPTLQERQDTGEVGSLIAVAVTVGGELFDCAMAQEPDE